MRRPAPLFAIFITIFLDMLAFGMAIPDLQLRGESLGAKHIVMGLLLSSFSLAQFLFAPILGRISDSKGRRPVLLVTSLMTTLGFVAYAGAHTLPLMFLARILGGLGGGNIGVAFAYIADITAPEDRAAGMGKVGAAFGLGFILGPPLGALLIQAGKGSPFLLGSVAATLCFLNFLFIYFWLPEPKEHRAKSASSLKDSLQDVVRAVRSPALGLLAMLYFAANFPFSNLEATYFRLLEYLYGFKTEGAYILMLVGVIGAVVQGGLIRHLVRRFGEVKLMRTGYLLLAPSLAAVPFAPPWAPLLLGTTVMGFAMGIANPSVSSLITQSAPEDMQGSVNGVMQSLGALARIFGPLLASVLFDVKYWAPYALGALIMVIPAVLARRFRLPETSPQPNTAVS